MSAAPSETGLRGQSALKRALASFKLFLRLIRFELTIYSLPLGVAALVLATRGHVPFAPTVWVVVALVSARAYGMAANRIIDLDFDRRNPRSAQRELASGRLSLGAVLAWTLAALAVFLIAVFHLSPLARKLWPIVIAVMTGYSYTKRWSWTCHFALGLVFFLVPPCVWIAVTNHLSSAAILLGVAGALWWAGFDMLYQIPDVSFDRAAGLHSLPADLGVRSSVFVSRATYAAATLAFVAGGAAAGVGPLYYVGVLGAVAVFIWQHALVARDGEAATVRVVGSNGWVGMAIALFALADVLVR